MAGNRWRRTTFAAARPALALPRSAVWLVLCIWLLAAGCVPVASADPSGDSVPTTRAAINAAPTTAPLLPRPTPPLAFGPRLPTPTSAVTTTPGLPTATPTVSKPLAQLPTPTPPPAAQSVSASEGFRVLGAFESTTEFADGSQQRQRGEVEVVHAAAANVYGADDAYRITTFTDSGVPDTVEVYQIGENILVRFGDDDWAVLPRAQGSGLVRAIQPMLSLPDRLVRVLDRAEFLGIEEQDGARVRRFRMSDPALFAELFATAQFQDRSVVKTLELDAWLDAARDRVLQYTLRLDVTGARVLDRAGSEVTADQSLVWTYRLVDLGDTITLQWPDGAPQPGVLKVPGFAAGAFPLPPNAAILASTPGIIEITTNESPDIVSAFYLEQLAELGWTVEGAYGLFTCRKGDDTVQLLIVEDAESGGSRVSVIEAE